MHGVLVLVLYVDVVVDTPNAHEAGAAAQGESAALRGDAPSLSGYPKRQSLED